MSDGPDNLVLVYLRRLTEGQDELKQEMRDVTTRLTLVEESLGILARSQAGMQGRIDKVDVRLERIERRLDLHEAHV